MAKKCNEGTSHTVYHIDLTPAVGLTRNDLLFSMVVLQGIQDNHGNVWTCKNEDLYMFEMTMTDHVSKKEFVSILPKTHCLSPLESLNKMNEHNIHSTEEISQLDLDSSDLFQLLDNWYFMTPEMQRPSQYLQRFHANQNLDAFFFLPDDLMNSHKICLETLLDPRSCPLQDPSYGELQNFINFLNIQLESCENSIFCNLANQEDWANLRFKNFVVKFMIHMAKDFSTRFIEISDESSGINQPEISERRRWESSHHPYIFFNEDGVTMSFFGISLDRNYNLINPDTGEILENNIMSKNLYEQLRHQNRQDQIPIFNMNFDNLPEQLKLRVLCRVLGVEKENLKDHSNMNGELFDPDPSYKLTSDNVKKLLAIYMRIKARIPVVCMGETGCGKTRMIKYLCDLIRGGKHVQNMIIVKVHGGLTPESIKLKVRRALDVARHNEALGVKLTVLFFDEANTTSAIGSIKELMVDRLNDGEPIPRSSTLQFICAVNPYRTHSDTMIKKLESAGLGYHIKAENTRDTLGNIPLRRLVYRVHALPLSLFPLVWDFGTVNQKNEKQYISQMVRNVRVDQGLEQSEENQFISVLCISQEFMRERKDECSFVSLRDVERTLTIFKWFGSVQHILFPKMSVSTSEGQLNLSSFQLKVLLALGVSYLTRLEKERKDYAKLVNREFGLDRYDEDILTKVVVCCQDLFVGELKLDSSIARNDALKENVWMMTLMIELKIPLFLVGKPGSSKSLAKTVIADIMQGQNSYSEMFKNFKEIHMVSCIIDMIVTLTNFTNLG